MRTTINIARDKAEILKRHLFQNDVEQGAFLFCKIVYGGDDLRFEVDDIYLVPKEGWSVQSDVHLEMRDSERGKIMKFAKNAGASLIDCHSHPNAWDNAFFSVSDQHGITEFAAYAKWKLDGRPFAAIVWGESSVDAVCWFDSFAEAIRVHEVCIVGKRNKILLSRDSWFERPKSFNGRRVHGN